MLEIHTELRIRVTTIGVLGRLYGRLIGLDRDLGLASTGLVVVVHGVAAGDVTGAHCGDVGVDVIQG